MRVDRKKLPLRWVAIYRAAAEQAAGRRLNGKERKALRDELGDKLLPRILPAVQIVDVLLDRPSRRALLCSTSRAMREQFVTLFQRTFTGVSLLSANPFEWARRSALSLDQRRYLEGVAPVAWPRNRETLAPPPAAPAAAAMEVEA
jgi:hypothetical protein